MPVKTVLNSSTIRDEEGLVEDCWYVDDDGDVVYYDGELAVAFANEIVIYHNLSTIEYPLTLISEPTITIEVGS